VRFLPYDDPISQWPISSLDSAASGRPPMPSPAFSRFGELSRSWACARSMHLVGISHKSMQLQGALAQRAGLPSSGFSPAYSMKSEHPPRALSRGS
jgi:hypothetical protein